MSADSASKKGAVLLGRGTRDRLEMQGFACRASRRIDEVEPWLRVTPAISTAVIIVGTAAGSTVLLWLFAALSGFAATRDVHPFDRISNVLRRRQGKPSLPINPPPRRFAMSLAALWTGVTGALFALGLSTSGYASGGLLSLAGLTVATTHFCVGSWLYQHVRRLRNRR